MANGRQGTIDQRRVTVEWSHVTSDRNRVTSDRSHVTSDRSRVTSDRSRVTSDRSRVTSDQCRVTVDRSHVTVDRRFVTVDQRHVTADRHPVSLPPSNLAQPNDELAIDCGGVASAPGRQTSHQREPTTEWRDLAAHHCVVAAQCDHLTRPGGGLPRRERRATGGCVVRTRQPGVRRSLPAGSVIMSRTIRLYR